jgi:DNA-binding SARP family transcriptional activator/tetratricopeptide (TPR) repeat protein
MPELRVDLLGGVKVTRDGASVSLAPFEAALVAVVYSRGEISRPGIARRLWIGEFDSRARHRLRQLISKTRKRVGPELFEVDGDLVRASSSVPSDVGDVRRAGGPPHLERAARALARGRLAPGIEGLPDQFDDWCDALWRSWERSITSAARTAWPVCTQAGEWREARDAAEAMVVLDPSDAQWVARLIEARGRSGQERSAEVAYSEYTAQLSAGKQCNPEVETIIEVVRALPGTSDTITARPPRFVGRRHAIDAITPLFDNLREGRPGFALVTGEAGIGKTRLLDELRRTAHLDGFRCLHARGVEFERVIALNPLVDALLSVDLESHLSALGEPWRSVIGEVLPSGALEDPIGELPLIQEENLSRRLFDAFSLLLDNIARERPTVLFLDDLHWADSTTVSTLQFFQRRSTNTPFAVVASIRPAAVGPRGPARALLSDDSKIVSHRFDLGDLSRKEAQVLVQDVMGDTATDLDTEAVIESTGCHPLYLIEVARNRADSIPKDGAPFGPMAVVPVSLREVLSARTRGLSEAARSVSAILAIGAGRMRLSELSALTGDSIDDVVETAEELQAARIVDGQRDRIWIAHDLFRGAIYHELSEPRRAVLHRRMAVFLQDRDDPPADELATHLDQAGDAAAAAEYGWIAGERCLARGTVAEAAHFYELTARNDSDPKRMAEATARQGIAHHLGRDMARAAPVLELASLRLRDIGDSQQARRIDIRRVEALAEDGKAERSDLIARLQAINEGARAEEDWEGVALALDREMKACLFNEDLDRVHEITNELESLTHRGNGYAKVAIHGALSVGLVLRSTNRAYNAASEALEHTRPNHWSRLVAMNRLLMVLVHRGRALSQEARTLMSEAAILAEASGDLMQRFSFESNRALGLMDSDLLDDADIGFKRAETLIGGADMTFARANSACNQGTLAIARGLYDEAKRHFERAATFRGPDAPRYVHDAVHSGLGLCALESGAMSEALHREAALRDQPKIWYYDPNLTMQFRARLLARRGEHDKAIDLLERTALAVEGRLVSAWVKLKVSQSILMARVKHPSLAQVARSALRVSTECGMTLRSRHFEEILLSSGQ